MAINFHSATLPNGLTVIGETNDAAATAAVGFFIKAGSRDETGGVMGVSHFLEHMMFKGTARRSADDVNREFDEIGANYNASTSQEVTNYWAHVLPEHLDRAIDLLGDMLRPALRTEDFEVEKKVILEEIGMYADHLFWVAYEQAMSEAYGDHPLGFRVLGTADTIAALRPEQMRAYFEHRYSPDNMIVSLSGRLDFNRCVEQIGAATDAWRRTGATRDYRPASLHERLDTIVKPTANMHYMIGLSAAPSAQDDDRFAAEILAHVLGDGDGSRLYWKLIDTGLADDAELSHHGYDRTGMYLMHASCDPQNAAEVEAAFDQVLDHAAEGLTDEEIERAAAKLTMDLTLQNERPSGRMQTMGAHWLYLGRVESVAEQVERLRSVTVADLRALIEKYPFRPRATARVTPRGEATE